MLTAAFHGFFDAVDVCVFILMVGGFLGVVMKTGAVDAGVVVQKLVVYPLAKPFKESYLGPCSE